jgi:hypothetical protein
MNENERISKFIPLIRSLYNEVKSNLGFEPHASISIVSDNNNANNPLGKTAYYSPNDQKIALYTSGRHIKDILRSLAHELVHHNQNCRGDFDNISETGPSYAQEDGHLREMEREAYEIGNMLFRDWEDNLKKKDGKPLFSSTIPYVPAMTSDVGGGRLFEDKTMTDKITKSQLRQIVENEMKKQLDEETRSIDWIKSSGQFRNSPEFKKTVEKLKAAGNLRPGTAGYNKAIKQAATEYGKRTGLTSKSDPFRNRRKADAPLPIPKAQLQGDVPKKTTPKSKRRGRKPSRRTKTIQDTLKMLGYDLGPRGVDGYYGPSTRAAVKKFQKDAGIGVDGIAGKNTIRALDKALNKVIAAQKPKKRIMPPPQPSGPMKTVDMETGEVYYDIPKTGGGTYRQTVKKGGYIPLAQRMFGKNFGKKKVSEENNMSNKLTESQLRSIIRNVIQEMFDEDLNEDNMGMPADAEEQEAMTTMAQSMEEDLQSTKGHFSDTMRDDKTDTHVDYQDAAMMEESEEITEDSGEKEKKNYKKNVKDDEKHIKKLEKDEKYDKDHEKLEESYFPQNGNIRTKARQMTNEALMQRWGYTKKEK